MKKTWKVFLTIVTALLAVVLVACGQGTASKDNKEAELKKIDFILDWTPNTNHCHSSYPGLVARLWNLAQDCLDYLDDNLPYYRQYSRWI